MQKGNDNLLTSGSLIRGLTALAAPMFVGVVLQNAQTLIDLFWVGRLGSEAVAALAVSGTVLFLMHPVVMGMATGTVALVSRAVGAGRPEDAADVAAQSLVLAVVFGLLTGAAGWFATDFLCRLLGASPEVVRLAGSFLRINFAGCFTVYVMFVASSVLQGAGNTVVPMFAMLLANAVNMILDPILIFGLLGCPRLEVKGAALATVTSQAVAMLVLLRLLHRGAGGVRLTLKHCRWMPALAWQILRIGVPSSGQILTRSLMTMVLMRIVAVCGTAAVAAYGIGMRFHMILLLPAFALGNAAATMVGQNLGARQPRRAEVAAWLAAAVDVGIMVAGTVAMLVFAPAMIRAFDPSPAVVAEGTRYLRTVSPFYVFTGLAIVFSRALNGAGRTVATFVFTVICLWGLQVPLAVWLTTRMTPPTLGIWWAIGAASVLHGLLTTAWFMTGRWKRDAGADAPPRA